MHGYCRTGNDMFLKWTNKDIEILPFCKKIIAKKERWTGSFDKRCKKSAPFEKRTFVCQKGKERKEREKRMTKPSYVA